jgi:dihydrodipicolinate synthase/N-acetylneuraminate lyase
MTTLRINDWHPDKLASFREGTVMPAHVLALRQDLSFDEPRMRALTRYYIDAGAGGVAVGVHTTQFGIRARGLYEPVLRKVSETVAEFGDAATLKVAGVTGRTTQALAEADTARSLGYDAALLNVAAFANVSEDEILEHCKAVAKVMPIIGFYLLTEVGGIVLSRDFWRRFCLIENVVGIKVAPFNRYRTLDVAHGLVQAGAEDRITLYSGNDDHIVLDLLTPILVRRGGDTVAVQMKGGLLGHWAIWTQRAVELFRLLQRAAKEEQISKSLLGLDSIVTDCNRAIYDSQNDFKGCIPGCHEVLKRQGIFEGTWCLDPNERLSPGQAELIEQVYKDYPEMNDDLFVKQNLSRWFS